MDYEINSLCDRQIRINVLGESYGDVHVIAAGKRPICKLIEVEVKEA